MERINYRITLDAFKNGVQRTLQGFETSDKMSRRISITLMAGGDTYDIPFDHVTAVMYVTCDGVVSVNDCTIDGNAIIYDVLPEDIAVEGITEMQLKLIEGRLDGAREVLLSPKFALEVNESNASDEGAENTPTFTALETAIVKAQNVYDTRITGVEVDDDCTFRVYYADGTTYENFTFKETLYNGNAVLSESYAKGGTGSRPGEDTDNSLYYKNVAMSTLGEAKSVNNRSTQIMNEMLKHSIYTTFTINFETGNLNYDSQNYVFSINENGELTYEEVTA